MKTLFAALLFPFLITVSYAVAQSAVFGTAMLAEWKASVEKGLAGGDYVQAMKP